MSESVDKNEFLLRLYAETRANTTCLFVLLDALQKIEGFQPNEFIKVIQLQKRNAINSGNVPVDIAQYFHGQLDSFCQKLSAQLDTPQTSSVTPLFRNSGSPMEPKNEPDN